MRKHFHCLWFLLLALIAFSTVPLCHAGPLPILRPKIGYPVVQELMGGCSLRCAFFWDTWAGTPPSPLKPASELCDDDAMTAWISSTPGPGEIIEFRIPKNPAHDCRDTPFYGISVANGVIKTLDDFRGYARVKWMTLLVNGLPVCQLQLADTWKWQNFHFNDILLNQGDIITLKIDEIYPGKNSQCVGITEVVLQGAH